MENRYGVCFCVQLGDFIIFYIKVKDVKRALIGIFYIFGTTEIVSTEPCHKFGPHFIVQVF